MSSYDATEAVFNEISSVDFTQIYSYGADPAVFADAVDLSLPGVIMDCGECHVGGAGMEYIPNSDLTDRTSLRDIDHADVDINGGTDNPISAGTYTAFNYFIDTFDADLDGNEAEVLHMDYDDTGVMEMDCLICHMPGYEYLDRTEMLRAARLDASRPVGAGFATVPFTTVDVDGHDEKSFVPAYGTANFGKTVTYDMDQFEARVDAGQPTDGAMQLPANWGETFLVRTPDSVNCAFCHMNKPSVDWKKRGDNWAPEGQWDYTYEVHYNIGCMGCHQRKPTAAVLDMDGVTVITPAQDVAADYNSVGPFDAAGANYPTQGAGLLGHDPAKGAAPFSSMYNKNDFSAFKKCNDCHAKQGDGGSDFGAPDPEAAHREAGLMDRIVQKGDMDGTMEINHIDLMECSACHSRKINGFDWLNSGNPMVDATGSDHEGRMTDHENNAVIKTDMTNRSSLGWYKGKILRVSYLNTMFYRDNGANTGYDANRDGRGGGMDPTLTTHINNVNDGYTTPGVLGAPTRHWAAITDDNLVETSPGVWESTVTGADFAERLTAINTYLGGAADTRVSMMHVAFKDQHGVSPAKYAWGSGKGNDPYGAPVDQDGCLDCHSAAAMFYNGSVNTYGDGVFDNISWTAGQVVPFTKVNGASQATDMHPNVKDRFGLRTTATLATAGGSSSTAPVEIPRANTLYETSFKTRAPFAAEYVGVAPPSLGGSEAGWLFMVEARNTTTQAITKRTRSLPGGTNVTDIAGLFAALGATFTGTMPEFTITNNGTGLTLTANAGYEVRLMGGIDNSHSYGLGGAAYVDTSWTTVTGDVIDNRAAWVTYLNSIGGLDAEVDLGLNVAPVATIDGSVPTFITLSDTVENGGTASVTLVADETVNGNGNFTYLWYVNGSKLAANDAGAYVAEFDYPGFYPVILRVINSQGMVVQTQQNIEVRLPAPTGDFSFNAAVDVAGELTINNIVDELAATLDYDRVSITWGDGTDDIYVEGDNLTAGDSATQVFNHTYTTANLEYATDMGTYYLVYVNVTFYDTWSVTGEKAEYIRIDK